MITSFTALYLQGFGGEFDRNDEQAASLDQNSQLHARVQVRLCSPLLVRAETEEGKKIADGV